MGPAGPLPGRRWNVFRRHKDITCGSPSVVFFDREDRAFLHLDVPHDANAAGPIAELDVVASGLDASDPQALVVVARPIPIILALVGTPALFTPPATICSVVIVYKVRFQNRIPLRS